MQKQTIMAFPLLATGWGLEPPHRDTYRKHSTHEPWGAMSLSETSTLGKTYSATYLLC